MFKCIKYFLLILFLLMMGFSVCCAQQTTRDQLLNLFYKAHNLMKAGESQAAISAYTEILNLSPGLPDPYLQLGDLYATMTKSVSSLKKATICYSTYLKLKPESSQKLTIEKKIDELKSKVLELENINSPQKSVIVADSGQILNEESGKNTFMVVSDKVLENFSTDTLLAKEKSVIVFKKNNKAPQDVQLAGRWISAGIGENGRETWIMDMRVLQDEMQILLNDSSSILANQDIWGSMKHGKATVMIENDTLVFAFCSELAKKMEKDKEYLLSNFGQMVDKMFDTGQTELSGLSSNLNRTEIERGGDSVVRLDKQVVDSLSDTLAVVCPKIFCICEFRLFYDGYKMSGTLSKRIMETGLNDKILLNVVEPCDLVPVPKDYCGFIYHPVSEELKANKRELRDLFNKKKQESANSISALNDLACMYASGIGIRKNMKMAVDCFMETVMKNSLFGMLNMARLYREGSGVEKDMEKARELYRRAYDSGYTDAMVLCGDTYLEVTADVMPDYQKALACYQQAVLSSCPFAAYRLGKLYHEGLGVQQDKAKSWDYYQQALEMQYPDAIVDVGLLYRDGDMVEKDYTKAQGYLLKAANKGNARAMFELSQMYLKGIGVKPDFKLAKDWQFRFMEANDVLIDGFNTVKSNVNAILRSK